uniref:Uncharacterized protein n=1 Tax=Arundo donax TaxID=35708 RepID=A0A0A9A1K0_ARUDO
MCNVPQIMVVNPTLATNAQTSLTLLWQDLTST